MAEKKIPKVRVGEAWVDAHRIWKVVESMTTATDLVEKYNENRPQLSTPASQDVVNVVRKRIRDMEIAMGGDGSLLAAAIEAGVTDVYNEPQDADQSGDIAIDAADPNERGSNDVVNADDNSRMLSDEDYANAAQQLVSAMSVDEALEILQKDYDNPIDPHSLIHIVGTEVYLDSLTREAKEFAANMIAPEQIAELWNESELPTAIGGRWTASVVEKLLP